MSPGRAQPTLFLVALAMAGCTVALQGGPSQEAMHRLSGRWTAPDSTQASVRAQFEAQHPSLARAPSDTAGDDGADTDEVLVGLPGFVRPRYEPGDWTDADEALAATEVARRVPDRLHVALDEDRVTIEGLHFEPMILP